MAADDTQTDDPTQGTDGQAETAAQGDQGNQQTRPKPAAPPPRTAPRPPAPQPNLDDLSPEELRAELERVRAAQKETNRKAQADRRRVEELEAAERDKQEAKLGEAERVNRRLKDAEARAERAEADREAAVDAHRNLRIDFEVVKAAQVAGYRHPEDVPRLIDRSRIEIDEDGEIGGVKEAVERFVKTRPDMVAGQRPGGGTPPVSGAGRGRTPIVPGAAIKQEDLEAELRGSFGYSF